MDLLDMSSSPQSRQKGDSYKFASFEGLRGLLAVLVCFGHMGLNTVAERIGTHVHFELAVDVFFALSGFVLAKSYYFGRRSFWRLCTGRVARLYPLHIFTFSWCLILFILTSQDVDKSLIWQNVLLAQNIGLPPNHWGFNFPSWSISVEMLASLMFFFILRRQVSLLAPGLAVMGVILAAWVAETRLGPAENYLGLFNVGMLRGISGFCIGAAAYILAFKAKKPLTYIQPATPIVPLVLLPFFFLSSWTWLYSSLFGVAVLFVLMTCAVNDKKTLLSSRSLVFLGSISYSVYLLHVPIYLTMANIFSDGNVRGVAGKMLSMVVVFAASILCHRFFELPMQKIVLNWLSFNGSTNRIQNKVTIVESL